MLQLKPYQMFTADSPRWRPCWWRHLPMSDIMEPTTVGSLWLENDLHENELEFESHMGRSKKNVRVTSDGIHAEIHEILVCSTPLLAPRIGLYTASVVSLKDALIGWSASDFDAPIQLWRVQINTGYTLPSPTWRASPTWRKQKAFPLPGTAALWVF